MLSVSLGFTFNSLKLLLNSEYLKSKKGADVKIVIRKAC